MKKIFLMAIMFSIIFSSVAMAEEELRISSVLPASSILRGVRGGIGPNYRNLTDAQIESGHMYIERGFDIGTMYDNADPNGHSAYINSMTHQMDVRVAEWANGYADGTMSGVVGTLAIGTDTIHSIEHLYLAASQNLVWRGNPLHVYRVSQGPGTFMLLGKTWAPSDVPGLYFQIAPVGAAGSLADSRCEVLRVMTNTSEIWTFASGSFVKGSGGHFKVNGTNVGNGSDISLKRDISYMSNVLDRIDTIRGVTFKWKDENDNSIHSGVIAQEVEKKFPELVHANPAGIKYVSYEGIDGVLIEAVKELKKEDIELDLQGNSIEKRAEELKKRNSSLENRISRLEKKI